MYYKVESRIKNKIGISEEQSKRKVHGRGTAIKK